MAMKNLLVRLRSKTSALSPKLREVADYVAQNPETVQFQTITELARDTKTSEASVIRMCRDFGFKGYSDFRMALAKDLSSSAKPTEKINSNDVCKVSTQLAMTALQDTEELIDRKTIQAVCELIHQSEFINCVAVGASSVVGSYLAYRLTRLGKLCVCFNDTHMASMNAVRGKGDMWFAISSSGSTKEVIHVASLVVQSGSPLAALSNIYHSPLASIANETLVAARPEGPLTGGAFASKVGALLLIDIIINSLIEKYPEYEKDFNQTAEATMELMV